MKYFIHSFKHIMCLLMEYAILFNPNLTVPDEFQRQRQCFKWYGFLLKIQHLKNH